MTSPAHLGHDQEAALIADYRVTDDQGDELRAHTRQVLASEPDVVPDVAIGLRRLCDVATDQLGFDGTSVTLITATGSRAVVAASEEHSRRLEEIQFDLGEGPALDAFGAGRPVMITDLRGSTGRWPGFAPVAVAEHMLAIFTFPLQLGAVRFGVLTFVNDLPRTLTDHEVNACLIFAEVATELLLDSSPTGRHPDPDLRAALGAREEVYQAQGMVMVDLGVGLSEALARMRALAFAESITLHELATDIVTGRRRLSPSDIDPVTHDGTDPTERDSQP